MYNIVLLQLSFNFKLDCLFGCLDLESIENGSLIYQLWTVVYWTTVALTDNGELGFGSGENA